MIRLPQVFITPIMKDAAKDDRAAALAIFLLVNTGSVLGVWEGRMMDADQRVMFGEFIGKGLIAVNGGRETVHHDGEGVLRHRLGHALP